MQVPERIQTDIIQFYSNGNCADARKLMERTDLTQLRPNVMAIAAYCEPIGYDPEVLFARAEQINPTGDLILILHAKYVSKKDPAASIPLWEQVLMTARNPIFRDIAKEHLAGINEDLQKERPLNLSPSTLLGGISISPFYRTNPEPPELSFASPRPSEGLHTGGFASYRLWRPFGYLGTRLDLNYDQFALASDFNLLNTTLETPIAIHVAPSKDLIFRPFTGYSVLGANPFRFTYGMGMRAAVYKGIYIQSVQGMFFTDRVFNSQINATQGSHYRFDFAWDFFPLYWTIATLLTVEHVSSTPTANFLGSTGLFEMSYNDLSLEAKFEREFNHFAFELSSKLRYRADTADSTYVNGAGTSVSKQRVDIEPTLKALITAPIIPSVQIFTWYEWSNIFSNFGALDFANYNYHNQTVGLGLRASLSTY